MSFLTGNGPECVLQASTLEAEERVERQKEEIESEKRRAEEKVEGLNREMTHLKEELEGTKRKQDEMLEGAIQKMREEGERGGDASGGAPEMVKVVEWLKMEKADVRHFGLHLFRRD